MYRRYGRPEKQKLVIPLFIKLVYEPVFSIHIPASLTPASSTDSADETAPAAGIGTGITIA